jgi:uncharacterized protein (TIGR02231 family)
MSGLDSRISTVTVYPDRARVTRTSSLDFEPGVQRVEFTELPLALVPDSARISARGSAQARLLGLQIQRAYFVQTPTEQVHQLEAQVEALEDEQRLLAAQEELSNQTRSNLAAIASKTDTYALALAAGEMGLEEQLALFERLRGRIGELDRELLELASRQRSLKRELEKLNKELDRWRGVPRREAFTAVVELEVLQAGSLALELIYVVTGAGWKPLYDLRLLEEEAQPALEVGYLAEVQQRTGETWQDVQLSLSTARPALASRLPELEPWYIRPQPPVVPFPAPRGMSLQADAVIRPAAALPKADFDLEMQEAPPVEAEVDTSGAAVTYRIPGTAIIPADGSPQKVTVVRYRLEPVLDYVTAPKLVEAAYRRAKVNNASQHTLLPGPANLFAGDEFIGTNRLELTAPQGEIELYLGVEDRIRVKREIKRREVDKKLIGSRRRLHYGYEIEIENLLPLPAEVTLHDQLPVSRHEEIKVRLDSSSPQLSEHSELNLLYWKLNLAPKEKRQVRFDFTVEYPQEMEVLGLA